MEYDKSLLRRVKLISCPLKGGGESLFLSDDRPAHQERIKTVSQVGQERIKTISQVGQQK